jgi:hypothetical protein
MKAPNGEDLEERLAALVGDEELLQDGERSWAVWVLAGGYGAAWIDENGMLISAKRKTLFSATHLAQSKWGR